MEDRWASMIAAHVGSPLSSLLGFKCTGILSLFRYGEAHRLGDYCLLKVAFYSQFLRGKGVSCTMRQGRSEGRRREGKTEARAFIVVFVGRHKKAG